MGYSIFFGSAYLKFFYFIGIMGFIIYIMAKTYTLLFYKKDLNKRKNKKRKK